MSRKKVVICLVILTILQIALRIYVGTQKDYYHMDEAYSYGLMNYDKINITDNEDFMDTWHDKEYYLDYFTVNSDEVWNFNPVYENQKNDVHPPLYYLLLRLSASFTIDQFTKWTGILLNCIIFAVSNIFVYLTAKKLFRNSYYALFTCLVSGCTMIALESALYIRMYELANLAVLITTYLHLKMKEEEKIKWTSLVFLGLSALMGGLTHYYYFIFLFMLYVIFTFQKIRKKDWKNLVKYQIALIIAGGIYLAIFPHAISHVLFSNRGISSGSTIAFLSKLIVYFKIILNKYWGYILPFLVLAIFTFGETKRKVSKRKNFYIILIPCLLYFLAVIKLAPFMETRYIIPVYACFNICTVYFICRITYQFFMNKTIRKIVEVASMLLICIFPYLLGEKLEFTYSRYESVVQTVEEKNLPIIYVWNPNENRFLDDIYLFTLVDRSIILNANGDEEKIKEFLKNQDGDYFLIHNHGVKEEILETCPEGKEKIYIERLNAADVLLVANPS